MSIKNTNISGNRLASVHYKLFRLYEEEQTVPIFRERNNRNALIEAIEK